VLVVDTVGFIQKLPHQLVAAFRATLEEVVGADLLVHVIDGSAEEVEEHEQAVDAVLAQIGGASRPRIVVLNKSDRIPPSRAAALLEARPGAILVSARSGEGLDALKAALAARLDLVARRVRLRFRAGESRAIAGVYAAGRVLTHEVVGEEVRIQAEIPERLLERYREHLQ
jgi:GTP-binding protein HflX